VLFLALSQTDVFPLQGLAPAVPLDFTGTRFCLLSLLCPPFLLFFTLALFLFLLHPENASISHFLRFPFLVPRTPLDTQRSVMSIFDPYSLSGAPHSVAVSTPVSPTPEQCTVTHRLPAYDSPFSSFLPGPDTLAYGFLLSLSFCSVNSTRPDLLLNHRVKPYLTPGNESTFPLSCFSLTMSDQTAFCYASHTLTGVSFFFALTFHPVIPTPLNIVHCQSP